MKNLGLWPFTKNTLVTRHFLQCRVLFYAKTRFPRQKPGWTSIESEKAKLQGFFSTKNPVSKAETGLDILKIRKSQTPGLHKKSRNNRLQEV